MSRRPDGDPKPFPRKDGRWQLDIQLGRGSRNGRVRHSLYGTSPDEVIAKRDRFLRRQRLGLLQVDEGLTVADYLAAWVDGLVDVRPRTVDSYRNTVDRHLVPELGHIGLLELRAADIRRAVRSIQARVGTRTAAYAVTVIRMALGVAVRDRLLERNEATEVRRPTVDRVDRDVLRGDGIRTFLEGLAGDRLEALYVLAVTTGMRRGELLGLRWRHVDTAGRRLEVAAQLLYRPHDAHEIAPVKTRQSHRAVALSARAVTALTEHRQRQRLERIAAGPAWGVPDDKGVRHSTDLVFTTAHGGPLAGSTVVHALHRHLKGAGLPRQRFHDLRHAAATELEPVLPRAEFLAMFGWTEGTTPARYTHARSVSPTAAAHMDAILASAELAEEAKA